MDTRRGRLFAAGVGSGMAGMLALAGLLAARPVLNAEGAALFVTPDGRGDCTQAAPCDLRTALGRAADGEAIVMSAGVYTGTEDPVMAITRSLSVVGGWDGSRSGPLERRPDLYPTIVDGEGARRGVTARGAITVALEGFTIARGVASDVGAGLYAVDANVVLRDMIFEGNLIDVLDVPDTVAYGGGAYIEGGSLDAARCVFLGNATWAATTCGGGGLAIVRTREATVMASRFEDNDAWEAAGLWFLGQGGEHRPLTLLDNVFRNNGAGRSRRHAIAGYSGAIAVVDARARIEGNTIEGNMAGNDYGALGVFRGDLELGRNLIRGNACARTAAVHLHDVKPFTLTNNIIADNRATQEQVEAAAVRVHGGGRAAGVFLHNTIAGNQTAYGLQVDHGAQVALIDTVLVGHPLGITVSVESRVSLEATLWGSGDWANGRDIDGAGSVVSGTVNLRGDPAFADPLAGDYHIEFASAARDAGVAAGVTVDIDGDPRPSGSGYDIGADEYVGSPTLASPTPSPSATADATPRATVTPTRTATLPHEASRTPTASPSHAASATATLEPGVTPSPTATLEPGVTASATATTVPTSGQIYLPMCSRGHEVGGGQAAGDRLPAVGAGQAAGGRLSARERGARGGGRLPAWAARR